MFNSAIVVTAEFDLCLQISGLQYFYHIHKLQDLNNNFQLQTGKNGFFDIKASHIPKKHPKGNQ
jgi:hypothetical protein